MSSDLEAIVGTLDPVETQTTTPTMASTNTPTSTATKLDETYAIIKLREEEAFIDEIQQHAISCGHPMVMVKESKFGFTVIQTHVCSHCDHQIRRQTSPNVKDDSKGRSSTLSAENSNISKTHSRHPNHATSMMNVLKLCTH